MDRLSVRPDDYAEGHDDGRDCTLTDFALAWLIYWRSIGNNVTHDGNGFAYFVTEVSPDELPKGPSGLPPHLVLWDGRQHEGATRAMQVLLDSVPGAREHVRSLVQMGG